MKIRVESQGRCFTIPVPTGLVFSDVTAWIMQYIGNKHTEDIMVYVPSHARAHMPSQPGKAISPRDMKRLFAELRRIKKRYGAWELVDVRTGDGQRVRITL